MMMIRVPWIGLCALLLLTVSFQTRAATPNTTAPDHCAPESLNGSYLYTNHGQLKGQAYASSGWISFDGAGQVVLRFTSSVERRERSVTGTYTVDENCAGSIALTDGIVNDMYLAPDGETFHFVRTAEEEAVGGDAQRVAAEREGACSVATFKGSYAYSIQGYKNGEPYASSGLMSFDGAGGMAFIYTRSIERTRRTGTGTYAVDRNCAGSMTLDKTTVNRFYLSPSGDRVVFTRVSEADVISTLATRVSEELIAKRPTAAGR